MTETLPVWAQHYDHPTPWHQQFAPLTMPDMFAQAVSAQPEAALLDFMGRKYSYADVAQSVAHVAAGLQALGIGRGDRIGLYLPNVPHYVSAYYGAMAIGATVVNFSPLYTVEELKHQVADSGTRMLFTLSAAALLPNALALLEQSALERLIVGSVAGALSPMKALGFRLFRARETARIPANPAITHFHDLTANDGIFTTPDIDAARDIALIQYTGGTTGVPKGAMLSHQNLTANARQINAIDPWQDGPDRILGALPFFHVFANATVLNRTIARGGEIVMLPRFDAGQALATIGRAKITAMPGVPTMYQALLDHPKLGKADFSSLQICISGGAPLAAELQAKFEAATGARLVEGYGLTETSGVVSSNPYQGNHKAGTIGQPIPATHVRLVDKEDPSKDVADGEPGELVIAGPQVMMGYWNMPQADAEVFIDGYLRTGDIATIDERGYVRIVDRLKDMIAVGGFKVFPSQIEAILYHHEAVREALVIGVPDAYRGESPKAFVALEPGAKITGEELKSWLNPQLGKHERVTALEVRDTLPKTMIGKLDRKALRISEGL